MSETEKLLAQLFSHVIEDCPSEFRSKHLLECLEDVVRYFDKHFNKPNERTH